MSRYDRAAARLRWLGIRDRLLQSTRSRSAFLQFERLQDQSAALRAHEDPTTLLEWLRDEGDGSRRDEKDILLRDLLQHARTADEVAPCAWTLLFLSFWGPLTQLFGKVVCEAGDSAVGEILDAFNDLVVGLDLSTTNRIAAALTRGTRRDVFRHRRRDRAQAIRTSPLPSEDFEGGIRFPDLLTEPPLDFCAEPPDGAEAIDDDQELLALREELVATVGDDADLVMGAAIYGVNQRVMAERMGISHAAARKRYQRTLKRLEHRFIKARRRPRCPTTRARLRSRTKDSGRGAP